MNLSVGDSFCKRPEEGIKFFNPLCVTGASLGISSDGCRMPNKPLIISMHGCKLPFDPCFQRKLMGSIRPFSNLMDAIAPIDPS